VFGEEGSLAVEGARCRDARGLYPKSRVSCFANPAEATPCILLGMEEGAGDVWEECLSVRRSCCTILELDAELG
jgi:hypothetical protein